jgi:hypothetical protein
MTSGITIPLRLSGKGHHQTHFIGIIEMMCENWPSPEGTMNINEG